MWLGGVSGGMVLLCRALPTTSTILSCVAATIVLDGRMVLTPSLSEEEWWRRDKASGLTFLEAGRYERVKLNQLKNSDHWA